MKDSELNQAKQQWAMGAHNNNLLSIADKYKKAGWNEQQAVTDMKAFYDSIDTPDKRDDHHKEVERAFAKAYNTEFIPSKTKIDRQDYAKEQSEWRSLQNADTDILKKIKAKDVSDARIQTKTALKALFKNCQGRVSQGKNVADISWMDTDDNFAALKDDAMYMTIATFGEMVDEDLQKEEEAKGGKKMHYERIDENVDKIACMLMEFDSPIGRKMKSQEFDAMDKAEQRKVIDDILADTCIVMSRTGISPTTVTFSGHKSFHCLFRMARPVDVKEWETRLLDLKSAYRRIGADEKILNPSRTTRMPRGCIQNEAIAGERQRVMYLDDSAEIDFGSFVDRLCKLADEICAKKEEQAIRLPIVCIPKKDKDGNVTKQEWSYNCERWDDFLHDIRLTKVYHSDPNEQLLIVSNEQGIFKIVKPTLALDHIVSEIRKMDAKASAHFRELRSSRLSKDNMEAYAGILRKLRMPKDTLACVYAPFKNGLLKIEKDRIYFHDGEYCDFDILQDARTLRRVFSVTTDKSEFEEFVEHACGSMENNPEWRNRKHSIMTLIGYMLCRKKEKMNYLNILTEETETENQGGTGKSIIMKSIQYWRKRFFKDMKRLNEQTQRFMWSGLKPFTDYAQLDDLPRGANLELFFSASTDEMEIERKGKDEAHLDFEDSPKFVIGTNYFPKGEGSSFYRRFKFFELSNHYHTKLNPEMEFGHQLFEGWSDDEWNRFDNFFVECVQTYLRDGLCECECTNIQQKRINSNMSLEMSDWIEQSVVCDEKLGDKQFPSEWVKGYFEWYKETYGQFCRQTYSKKFIKSKVKELCDARGYSFDNNTSNVARNGAGKCERYVVIDVPKAYQKPLKNVLQNEATKSFVADPFLDDAPDATPKATEEGGAKCSKTGFVTNAHAGAKSECSKVPEELSDDISTDLQNQEGSSCYISTSTLYSQLEEKSKNTFSIGEYTRKSNNVASHVVIDRSTGTFEIHFSGKRPKPECVGVDVWVYDIDGHRVHVDENGENPDRNWKIVEDEA